jgi:hypothetical protein
VTQRPSWLIATGLIYLGLVASLFTDVHHPFSAGDDHSGWVLLVFGGAQLALGAAWRTPWTFALPLPLGIIAIILAANGDDVIGVIFAIIAIPVAYVLVAIGRAIGWVARRRSERAAVIAPLILFIAACAPLAVAAREPHHVTTGPRLSAAEASRLPLAEFTLNQLCNPALERHLHDELTAQAHALISTTRRRGDHVITAIYYNEGDPDEQHEDMTVRKLAENQLDAMHGYGRDCQPTLRRALADAIG